MHVLTCREGACVLHQLRLYHGNPAGQQPPATPAGPVLPAHCILWGVPATPSHSQKGNCCLWLPLLHLLWHDRVLRQDQHVTTTDGLLQSQVCSCLVWGPLAKLMWQVRLSMTCCHCCKQDSSIIPTIHIDHAHDVTYDSDADTCPHDHINFCIALIL